MAAYEYDEGGGLATYFLITFLALILIPFTLASLGGKGGMSRFILRMDVVLNLEYRENHTRMSV